MLAQSIGAGGGFVAAPADQVQTGPLKLTLGGTNGASGNGGAVSVTTSDTASIATSGRNAHGIVAQSIGGGGGVAGLTTAAGAVALNGTAANSYGDAGAVSITASGVVRTSGDGAVALLAQSIGGGGGLAGDAASARYDLGLVRDARYRGSAGEGRAINIMANNAISTSGRNAPAILAMSIGSGAVFSDGAILLGRPWEPAGNMGGKIDIGVGKLGVVSASGQDSPAIYAVSTGNSGSGNGGTRRGQDIDIVVYGNGVVRGGTGELGAGIATVTTELTRIDNFGTISSLGGLAIQTAGRANVSNSGTIAGNLLLGAGSSFDNREGGQLHSGPNLTIATLTNSGVLDPGGPISPNAPNPVFVSTRLTGSLQQTGSGTYAVDLDFLNRRSDHLSVSGASRFDGTVTPQPLLALPDVPLEIARFDQPLQSYSAVIKDGSPIFRYQLTQPQPQSVAVAMSANFMPTGLSLSADQASKAAYLQQVWNGGAPSFAPLFGQLTRIQSEAAYRSGLDEIGNDATGARTAMLGNGARAFSERMNSCPAFFNADARMAETDCVWGRSVGTLVDRSGSRDDSGYVTKQLTLQVGGQRQIQPGWFLGGSLGYNAAHTTTSLGDVDIRSQGVTAGLVLKREIGPWLFSASLLGGYDNAEIRRDVALPGFYGRASANSPAAQIGGKLRASYQFSFADWYLKPMLDLDLHFTRQYGYRERGTGPFDLAMLNENRLSAMITPALEIGGRFELAGMIARAYLNGGVSFSSQDGWTQKQRFSAAGSGDGLPAFESETGMPRTYGNAKAGIELFTRSGWELKAEYSLRAASGYREQSAELRAALRF